MAAAGLPLLKLSTLLVKTIAKPLGGYVKSKAKQFPILDRALYNFGNSYHYAFVRVNVLASGHKFISCRPLPHDQGLKDGTAMFSEGLVLGFSAFVILVETARSQAKAAASKQKLDDEKHAHEVEQDRQRKDISERLKRLENIVGRHAVERETERMHRKEGEKGGWLAWLGGRSG